MPSTFGRRQVSKELRRKVSAPCVSKRHQRDLDSAHVCSSPQKRYLRLPQAQRPHHLLHPAGPRKQLWPSLLPLAPRCGRSPPPRRPVERLETWDLRLEERRIGRRTKSERTKVQNLDPQRREREMTGKQIII
ncbi:uncharacterized protein LOC122244020 [Penaeus japonicus]|uniref:uncharacterized protein LOC122244020 n=1 Tax=Penaeus japonicus TaxID=27405 RepID=UPI001C710250|nr:uncharacterized protein LOC122244020 [Penaeus japonicus]